MLSNDISALIVCAALLWRRHRRNHPAQTQNRELRSPDIVASSKGANLADSMPVAYGIGSRNGHKAQGPGT